MQGDGTLGHGDDSASLMTRWLKSRVLFVCHAETPPRTADATPCRFFTARGVHAKTCEKECGFAVGRAIQLVADFLRRLRALMFNSSTLNAYAMAK